MAFSYGFGRKKESIEYVVGRKADGSYSVSKFQGSDVPLEVYGVDYNTSMRDRKGQALSRCECMAWRSGKTRPCKHIDMVALYVRKSLELMSLLMDRGRPVPSTPITQFVCIGEGSEWRFERCEPNIEEIRRGN